MTLKSKTFANDQQLKDCARLDSAHLTIGAKGDSVAKVQAALEYLDDLTIEQKELDSQTYGPSTAAAVLAYKQKRKIINYTYQKTADNIVGIMTITRLDEELAAAEEAPMDLRVSPVCCHRC